ncbi:MAG: protein phosphatase 2C domain-containing protein [Deinococcus sp.]|nr:protein phosphatase 2C domain-containing protein [Deinococcus sp.]
MVKRCPECGEVNAADGKFCANCGGSLQAVPAEDGRAPLAVGEVVGASYTVTSYLGERGGRFQYVLARPGNGSYVAEELSGTLSDWERAPSEVPDRQALSFPVDIVECAPRQSCLVVRELSAQQQLPLAQGPPLDATALRRLARSLAQILLDLAQGGFHYQLTPDTVALTPGGEVRLIDPRQLSPLSPSRHSSLLSRLGRRQEEPKVAQELAALLAATGQEPALASLPPGLLSGELPLEEISTLPLEAPSPRPSAPLPLVVQALTHQGRVRSQNQDALLVVTWSAWEESKEHRRGLFAVADGMGGHRGGEVASSLLIRHLADALGQQLPLGNRLEEAAVPQALLASIESASAAIREEAKTHPELSDMGSTLAVAYLVDNRLYYTNVGDARVYLLRGTSGQVLTKDHSLVQGLLEAGQITSQEMRTHPQRNIVTLAVPHPDLAAQLEVGVLELSPEHRVMLCSDGLWDMLSDERIAELGRAPHAAQALIDAANAAGGEDNITVIVLASGREAEAGVGG